MIIRDMPTLEAAINEESYEWLNENYPILAEAVKVEVRNGATPAEIRRKFMADTQRFAMAKRLEQAAAYLVAVK